MTLEGWTDGLDRAEVVVRGLPHGGRYGRLQRVAFAQSRSPGAWPDVVVNVAELLDA